MKYPSFNKKLFFLFFFLTGCSTLPSTLPWLNVEWKEIYKVAKNGAATYYYGDNYTTVTITKSLFIFQEYTNNRLILKQTYPIIKTDEAQTIVSYDCSTTANTMIAVVMCKVDTNKMEITNYTIYITNKSSGADSILDRMEEYSALGFTKK